MKLILTLNSLDNKLPVIREAAFVKLFQKKHNMTMNVLKIIAVQNLNFKGLFVIFEVTLILFADNFLDVIENRLQILVSDYVWI